MDNCLDCIFIVIDLFQKKNVKPLRDIIIVKNDNTKEKCNIYKNVSDKDNKNGNKIKNVKNNNRKILPKIIIEDEEEIIFDREESNDYNFKKLDMNMKKRNIKEINNSYKCEEVWEFL
jgi:hypothetical protein